MKDLFINTDLPVVTSDRILYTPSNFAKTSLIYLQEIGSLRVHKPHSTGRSNLASYLFFTVTDGTGELSYEGMTYSLQVGDCVFIDCRKQYAHSSSEKLWSLSWIHFYGPNLAAIYDKYLERGGRAVFHPVSVSDFLEVYRRVYELADSDDYIRDMKINSELNYFLTLLMNESWHPRETIDADLKRQNVLPVKQYLDEHYSEKISLDFLADHFFISKYYLTRVFKQQFGVSISNYLMTRRVTKAKYMLRFTGEKIKAIGYECGLGEPHYFSRIFKQMEGMSPLEYREKWKR